MLRQYELIEKVKGYDPDADEELLNRAYVFSMRAHGSQLRASGDPYFSHPIEVAGILTDLKLDAETIATAILHDTIEDTVATNEQIEQLFGPRIARLVDGVTKLSRLEVQTESERAAENFRKFVLAMSDDIRVLLVKLADRLHNMRTLHHIKSADKRRRIARETMDIYAPLAERIGMYELKDELAAIAFRELEPEAWQSITAQLSRLRDSSENFIPRVIDDIRNMLANHGIEAGVYGREKRPFSIWRKMQERDIQFEQLSDVIAFRVVVDSVEDCYAALGHIHRRWPMVPGRFKDFISTPRRNGYRSLHTTVMTRDQMRLEIQIRTREMHREAELGLAAHWAYKQQTKPDGNYPWLQDLLEILEHGSSAEELMEHTRLAMYADQIFCFTPKGELIQLPRGSTPVDFAYAVHTELGDTCVGAKVNGRLLPLRTRLESGDQVEILHSKAQHPDPAWEAFVVTGKARSSVRRFVRQKQREDGIALGRQLLGGILRQLKIPLSDEAISLALGRLKMASEDELLLALANRTVTDQAVYEAILPGSTKPRGLLRRRLKNPAKSDMSLSIKGLTPGVTVHLSECCHPVAGDRIVGIRTPGKGVMVHTIDCHMLDNASNDPEAWVDLSWDRENDDTESYVARLSVIVVNETGALATVTQLLASNDANIANLRMLRRDSRFHTYVLDVEVSDLAHLTNIIADLRAARAVNSVERVRE